MEEVKRLYRSKSNAMLGGVCGGMGDYFKVDPVIIRLIWVVFGLAGAGLLAYIIAWIIIPSEDSVKKASSRRD